MMIVEVLVSGIFAVAVWLPLFTAHAIYIHRRVPGHLILGNRRLVHRLMLMPLFRFLCSLTFSLTQLLIMTNSGDHWIGMLAAFRILAVIVDKFVYYGVLAVAWKSWHCARTGFSRNEARTVTSLVIFTAGSDLIWLATEATGRSAFPALIFRTTFYMYLFFTCITQTQHIKDHVKRLSKAVTERSSSEDMQRKLTRFQHHLYAHQCLVSFITFFGPYCVTYFIAHSEVMLPKQVPFGLMEDLAYLLVYLFLTTLVLKKLIY